MDPHMSLLSVVVPTYNEEQGIEEFHKRLSAALPQGFEHTEILFVNDGSQDKTQEKLEILRRRDARVRIVEFSRNFGHQIAIKAGIDHSRGDAVVVIDADLQDPPELIPEMVKKWREGYDVVYAVRSRRIGESFFRKSVASVYYRLMRMISGVDIPLDTGDYRLISRAVADELKRISDKNPYIRGLVSWLGFRQVGVMMERQARFAGESKYSLSKLFQLGLNGITQFSSFPLRIAGVAGWTALVLGMITSMIVMVRASGGTGLRGWSVCLAVTLVLSGVQLLSVAVLGGYLFRNLDQARTRPLYVIRRREGFDA